MAKHKQNYFEEKKKRGEGHTNNEVHPNVQNAVISAISDHALSSYEHWLHSKSKQSKDECVWLFHMIKQDICNNMHGREQLLPRINSSPSSLHFS